ncbi:MAG: cobalt-precorrin-5B (C(1))-methyltransferase [Proteobacteria bacterium]|nr:cobalt-precorrin-5B (C(1))-methyltransferase [Pseudomonadota bacterium]
MTDRQPSERKPPKSKTGGPLKKGWTTGACATAAATAAYQALLTGDFPDPVSITLPRGQEPSFPLKRAELSEAQATASVIKDAGDDPDVTHGAEIVVTVALENGGGKNQGVRFHAGEGVGTVTRPGLALAVGEPAINPGPRAMIEAVIEGLTQKYGHGQGGGQGGSVAVTIAIPGGEKLAEKTLNGRLGIEGGLSILGTTGIVIPYSCSSWIHSIHRGVDVARASGHGHLAAATGRTSEAAVQKVLGLPDVALIDMGDFAGGVLKYLRKNPVEKLTLAGGPGKIAKLAQGAMDLHSSKSRVHMGALADMLSSLGAEPKTVEAVKHAATAGEALAAAGARGLALGDTIARQAREVALATLAGDTEVEVMIFDREGKRIGHGG